VAGKESPDLHDGGRHLTSGVLVSDTSDRDLWQAIKDIESGSVEDARESIERFRMVAFASGDSPLASRLAAAIGLCRLLTSLDRGTIELEEAHRAVLIRRDAERRAAVDSLRALLLSVPSEPEAGDVGPAIAFSGFVIPFALGVVEIPLPGRLRGARTELKVRLLGPCEVEVNGHRLERWRSNRARLLFAYLVLNHPEPVSRQHLMGLFWPEHSEERAENNLSLTVMATRRILTSASQAARDLIGARSGVYALEDADVWLDARAFSASVERAGVLDAQGQGQEAARVLDEAMGLYAGQLLSTDLFEDWTIEPRQRLEDLFTDALMRRGRLARLAGDLELSVQLNRSLLERDPAAEEAHRQLILDYLNLGQRSRALRQVVACREALQRHLGVAPGAATLAVFRQALDAHGP